MSFRCPFFPPSVLAALLLLLGLLVPQPVGAQSGVVVGGVLDETGRPLPGATVELHGPDGVRVAPSGPDGAYRFESVPSGRYRVDISLEGFAPAALDDVFAGEGAVVVLPAVGLSLAAFGDTVVVTATRLPIRLLESPVSTSVVTPAVIGATTGTTFAESLRSVPGLNVTQLGVRDFNVATRTSSGTTTRSQLVLVDGRSVYLDFFGIVLWDLMPFQPDDVSQIEVVKGPASASWGVNALTGVVNIVTRPPRETPGATLTFSAGWADRNAGTTRGQPAARLAGVGATVSRAPTERLAYRVSAGYFHSDAFARPVGRIPPVPDPRIPAGRLGGGFHPVVPNPGTAQPKFDARVDYDLPDARLTVAGGVAGTEGPLHTALGPFAIQRGAYLGYSRIRYERGPLHLQAFGNFLDGDAPSLLLADAAAPDRQVRLGFRSRTLDLEAGHSAAWRGHSLSYGGNLRRNDYAISIAPLAQPRWDGGAYLQDEVDVGRFRISGAARIDKFGALERPFVSPRAALAYRPTPDYSVTGSYNRSFRGPSVIDNWLDLRTIYPVDLSELDRLRPLLGVFVPPSVPAGRRPAAIAALEERLAATTGQPFPLVVRSVGSDVPFGDGRPRPELLEESVSSYELGYTGVLPDGTTVGASVYRMRFHTPVALVPAPLDADPYTGAAPPPGWLLPGPVLDFMLAAGQPLPRTAFTHVNLPDLRQWGWELWAERRFGRDLQAWANYSRQSRPTGYAREPAYPPDELMFPPAHRFNLGVVLDGARYEASASASASTSALWSDVLTPEFHGFTTSYTLVNAAFGVKWRDGRLTTGLRVSNLLNSSIQQHLFGDVLRRVVVAEVRVRV